MVTQTSVLTKDIDLYFVSCVLILIDNSISDYFSETSFSCRCNLYVLCNFKNIYKFFFLCLQDFSAFLLFSFNFFFLLGGGL